MNDKYSTQDRIAFEHNLNVKLKSFSESYWDENCDNRYLYVIVFYDNKTLQVGTCSHFRHFGQVYFSSKEVAEQAIERYRYDLIKYFTNKY